MHYVLRDNLTRAMAIRELKAVGYEPVHEVIIRPYKTRRSLEQNRLLHAIFREVSDLYAQHHNQRYSPDTWKVFFKRLYLGSESTLMPDGTVNTELRSTAKLNTEEMTAFIEQIRDWCWHEQGWVIEVAA